jgi:hypothetical protein
MNSCFQVDKNAKSMVGRKSNLYVTVVGKIIHAFFGWNTNANLEAGFKDV